MAKLKYDELTIDSKKEVDELIKAIDILSTDKDYEDVSKVVDIVDMKLPIDCKRAKLEADMAASPKKIFKLTTGLSTDKSVLYYFAKDYPKKELQGKAFIVKTEKGTTSIYAVNAVVNAAADPKIVKAMTCKGFAKDLTTISINFNRIRAYDDGRGATKTEKNLKFIGHLGSIIKDGIPKIKIEDQKDVVACFDIKTPVRSVVYDKKPKTIFGKITPRTLNAYRTKKKLGKESRISGPGWPLHIHKVEKTIADKPQIKDDTVQLLFIVDSDNPNEPLNVFLNINPEGLTKDKMYTYDAKKGVLKDKTGAELPIDVINNTKTCPPNLFKVATDKIKILDDKHVAIDMYEHGTRIPKKGEASRRVVMEVGTPIISLLLEAQRSDEEDSIINSLGSLRTELGTEGWKSVENLNANKNKSLKDAEKVLLKHLDADEANRQGLWSKISPMLKSDNVKIGLWKLFLGAVATVGIALVLSNGAAAVGQISLGANSERAENEAAAMAKPAIEQVADFTQVDTMVMRSSNGATANITTKTTLKKGLLNYEYDPSTNKITTSAGTAQDLIANQFKVQTESGSRQEIVSANAVAKKVSAYGKVMSYSGIFSNDSIYQNETSIGLARALGETVANEAKTVRGLNLKSEDGEVSVVYPDGTGSKDSFKAALENAGYSSDLVAQMTTEYTNAFTAAMNVQAEDNASFDATEDPTLPEGYDEIYDAEDVYYTNNTTLQTTLNKIVGLSKFNINTINVVSTDSGSLVTIFVTPGNDTSVAYEISFNSDSTINTTRELCTALENAIKNDDYSKTTFKSIDTVLSQVGRKTATINSYKNGFIQGVEQKLGASLQEGGNIYVYSNAKVGEFEVAYINANSTVTFDGFVEGNVGGVELPAIGAFYVTGGQFQAQNPYTVESKITTTTYNNQGETHIEQDLATPENDGREM